jgi:hypothetical protein
MEFRAVFYRRYDMVHLFVRELAYFRGLKERLAGVPGTGDLVIQAQQSYQTSRARLVQGFCYLERRHPLEKEPDRRRGRKHSEL